MDLHECELWDGASAVWLQVGELRARFCGYVWHEENQPTDNPSLSAGFIIVKPPVYASWIRWLSPYFYSFRVVATVVFKDRKFNCPGTSLANLQQCDGNNVLRGFDIDANINIGAWFGGLVAFAIFEYTLSCFILWVRSTSTVHADGRSTTAAGCGTHLRSTRGTGANKPT